MVARRWLGLIYLALSENRVVRSLRQAPLLGAVVHGISHLFLPWNSRIWVEVEDGLAPRLKLHLNPRYDSGYWRGDYEENIRAVFAKHLKLGDVMYDVGANIGFFSLLAARLVGPPGLVFAFEPDPDNASRIQEHIEANSLKQISVVTSPVWSSNERVFFARSSDHSSRLIGSVTMARDSAEGFYLQAVTLDDFARRHGAPMLVKMDVEGGEAEVLKGALRVFSDSRPRLLCEVHHEAAARAVRDWLRERSYTFEWMEEEPTFPRHLHAWSE
jgi:FkbM family methyltransferase